ncbi:hypothetical protein RvY_13209 [Ramazzottius varieornatus]|uniref:Uncharacterized protein n=1 Tax=Ramazzottius varieornatus TaxID=947166 RepID=A0A1D1VR57_RAMVA|nr:hypothetical protein RvY_13209 [Ramazzottius varieornatus]
MFRLHNEAEEATGFGGTHRPPTEIGAVDAVSHPPKAEHSQQTTPTPHAGTSLDSEREFGDAVNIRNTGGSRKYWLANVTPPTARTRRLGSGPTRRAHESTCIAGSVL